MSITAESLRVGIIVAAQTTDEVDASEQLATGLARIGHRPVLVGRKSGELGRGLLERRGFPPEVATAPGILVALARGGFDVVHAVSPIAAAVGLSAPSRRAAPLVFTCAAALRREGLADRRLRLAAVERAFWESDARLAASVEIAEAARRWFALDLEVVAPGDAGSHERVYRELLDSPVRVARRGDASDRP